MPELPLLRVLPVASDAIARQLHDNRTWSVRHRSGWPGPGGRSRYGLSWTETIRAYPYPSYRVEGDSVEGRELGFG